MTGGGFLYISPNSQGGIVGGGTDAPAGNGGKGGGGTVGSKGGYGYFINGDPDSLVQSGTGAPLKFLGTFVP